MISYLANPARFERFARYASPIFGTLAIISRRIIGLYYALVAQPRRARPRRGRAHYVCPCSRRMVRDDGLQRARYRQFCQLCLASPLSR